MSGKWEPSFLCGIASDCNDLSPIPNTQELNMDASQIKEIVGIGTGVGLLITQIIRVLGSTKAEVKWNNIRGRWQKFLRAVELILISSRNKKD